jgi:hypothetical protein
MTDSPKPSERKAEAADPWEKIGETWFGPKGQCPQMNNTRHAVRLGHQCICGFRLVNMPPSPNHTGPTASEVREAYTRDEWASVGVDKPLPGTVSDPYNPYNSSEYLRVLEQEAQASAMAKLPGDEAARLRNVAALKSELGREVTPPRFPSPGRDCRVLKVNR